MTVIDLLARYTHLLFALAWVCHNYASFIQNPRFVPLQNGIDTVTLNRDLETRMKREHGIFRYASLVVWISGLLMLWQRGWLEDALLLQGSLAVIGLGTLMLLNLCLLIVRDDLLKPPRAGLPSPFSYTLQAEQQSRLCTPPTFALYCAGLMLRWIRQQGGLAAMASANRRKSEKLYRCIDTSDLYQCPQRPADRSAINACFQSMQWACDSPRPWQARRLLDG